MDAQGGLDGKGGSKGTKGRSPIRDGVVPMAVCLVFISVLFSTDEVKALLTRMPGQDIRGKVKIDIESPPPCPIS